MSGGGRQWISGLPEAMDRQRQVLLNLLDWCEADERVAFFAVACSVGRGAGDSLSDLDTGMALDVSEADFDAAVADVRRAVDGASDLVESYHHKLPGVNFTHERIFAQYASRCQVDLVVIPASVDYGSVKDEVVLYDPRGVRTPKYEQRPVTPTQVREWAFDAWACLADVGKYLRRQSYWEALERLHQARNDYWRLLATAVGVPNPQYGITSLLDYAPERVSPEMSDTVGSFDHGGLLLAARQLAAELNVVGDLLAPELRTALPGAMAGYITDDLAATAAAPPPNPSDGTT